MATDDLFAPPSEEELYEAPTAEELAPEPNPRQDDVDYGQLSDEEKRKQAQAKYEEANKGMSVPEAFAQNAAPAATLGLSDIVAGAAGSAGHLVGGISEGNIPSGKELLDTYYEAKKNTQQTRARAMEEQPVASLAGMVAGGFANPIPGMVLKNAGKVGAAVSEVLPSLKGVDKISKAGKLAEKARLLGDMDKYKALKNIQNSAALKLAMREGAKAGGLSAATMGESKLLEGDVNGFVDEVLHGTVAGAGIGAGFSKGTQVVGNLIKKLPGVQSAIDSFRYGSKGINLDEAEVNHSINKAAAKYIKDFDDRLNSLKIDKEDILNTIDELGVTINTKSDLKNARRVIEAIESDSHRKKASQFLDVLDDYLGEGKAFKKAKESLTKKIAKTRFSDPVEEARIKLEKQDLKNAIESQKAPISSDEIGVTSSKDILPGEGPDVKALVKHNMYETKTPEGVKEISHQMRAQNIPEFKPSAIQRTVDPESGREVAMYKDFGTGKVHAMVGDQAKALDAEKLTTTQASKLKDLMNEYSVLAKKENLPNDVKRAATDAAKMINEKINGAAKQINRPLTELNKKMSGLIGAKERMGIDSSVTQYDKEESLKSMAKFIAGIGDTNPVSDKNLVLQRLRKVDPKMAEQVGAELEDLRRQYELSKTSEGMMGAGKMNMLLGSAKTVWNKAWNSLGKASTAPIRTVQAVSGAAKNSLATTSLNIVEASPAQVQGVLNKIKESANKSYQSFQGPLQRAMEAKPRTKQAILYGLYQQPAFREMIKSFEDTEEGEE